MGQARVGMFDDLLDGVDPTVAATARALRAMILEVHPEAVEVVRLGDRAATYGVGPRKMIDGYAYVMPLAGWVNLGLYKGGLLPDPEGRLEGSGAVMRHVKVRSPEAAADPALRALISEGLAERRRTRSGGTGGT